MESEIHSFILWENARHQSKKIIKDLEEKFQILEIFGIFWPKKKFAQNLKRFYGITLTDPHKKESICGNGSFLLIIVLDKNPIHGKRKTSLGSQIVNTNIYDHKMQSRRILGSGYIIHSSIHQKEANHDFTLLLGKNIDQLKTELKKPWNGKIKEKHIDLFGNEWKNPKQIFLVLNAITKYVVLRNFENLPEELNSNEHKDIDLLTDDQWQLPYILNMSKVDSNNVGFSPVIKIGSKEIKLDIKYVGDKYYDEKWSKDILRRRVLSKNGVYTPSKEDHFFTLLYHVIIHKKKIIPEYIEKLYLISPQDILNNYKKNDFSNFENLKVILKKYMKENGYRHTNSIEYRFTHNEITRILNVIIFTIKHEGLNFLFRAIKSKIKRIMIKESKLEVK
jgi:hypothetical protein